MSEEQDLQGASTTEDSSASEVEENSPQIKKYVQNPFFNKNKRAKLAENSDSEKEKSDHNDSDLTEDDSDSDFSDSEDDSDEEKSKPEPEIDEEDPLIQALKKAKEKSERKSPMDVKSKDMITDVSFSPMTNLIAHCTINGKVFFYFIAFHSFQWKNIWFLCV